MTGWPYPGDSPVARARRIARAYREHLAVADPARCAELDAACEAWGQTWIAPRTLRYDLDDWLRPADAADIAAVSVATLRKMRTRGRLVGRRTSEGWRYRARDVLALATGVRTRSGGRTSAGTGTLRTQVEQTGCNPTAPPLLPGGFAARQAGSSEIPSDLKLGGSRHAR